MRVFATILASVSIIQLVSCILPPESTTDTSRLIQPRFFGTSFTNILHTVRESVEDALGSIQKTFRSVRDYIFNIVEAAKKNIKSVAEQLKSKIATFIEQAKKLSNDVEECVISKSNVSESLSDQFVNNIINCYSFKVAEAENVAHKSNDSLNNELGIVNSVVNDIRQCEGGLLCITKIELASAVEFWTTKIKEIIGQRADTVDHFGKLQTEVQDCVENTVLEASRKEAQIISDIKKCFDDKQQN